MKLFGLFGDSSVKRARATRGGSFDFLIPVPVTGIQPDQVLGLKELFPRRRRGAAFIFYKQRDDEGGEIAVLRNESQ
jgi:hypothetical protein